MFHGTLTLLTRALKMDARQRQAHAVRMGAVFLILAFLITAHATSGGIGAPGLGFFRLISWLNLALVTLAGASYFATAITEEKEEGTLGLLQLAGVSPLGILLGKSTSRLITALLLFAGQLPFALLAISLGGLTAHQILAAYVAIAAYLVMVANVGLLSSVVFRRSGSACVWMALFLVLLLGVVPAGTYSLSVLTRAGYLDASDGAVSAARSLLDFVERHSVITRVETILRTGFKEAALSVQVVLSVLIAGVAFGLAWMVFERFTRYEDASTPSRGWLPRLKARRSPLIERPWRQALMWKDYHFITGGHTLALIKLAGYPALLFLLWFFEDWVEKVVALRFVDLSRSLMLTAIGGELVVYASRMFREEVKWGTLPNLALLPRSVAWIAFSKTAGCLLALMPAFIVLMGLYAVLPARVRPLTDLFAESEPWFVLMQFLVLIHLTVLCSLIVKWGALAAAIATLLIADLLILPIVGTLTATISISLRGDAASIGPIIYTGCAACAVLQFLITIFFRRAAAR